MRTLEAAPSRPKVGLLHPRSSTPRVDAPSGLPRPSWSALVIATAVVAGLTWGIASRRTNEIDPSQVIAVNLTAAKLAIEDARFVEPAEHSAAYYYRMVLAIDPTNEDARAGLDAVAEELLDQAKRAILSGRFAEAVDALDHTRRIAPGHRRISFVETELRRALDVHAASVKTEQRSETPVAADDMKVEAPRRSEKQNSIASSDAAPILKPSVDTTKAIELRELPASGVSNADASSLRETSMPEPVAPIVLSETDRSVREREYVALDTAYQLARGALASSSGAGVSSSELPPITESPPITVSAERATPKLASLVEPEYPKSARVRGIEGWVDLTLSVDASGSVVDARVDESKGTKSFERAALSAVRQWRYEGVSTSGAPQQIPVRVEFRLQK